LDSEAIYRGESRYGRTEEENIEVKEEHEAVSSRAEDAEFERVPAMS
jgi:hypothetical protein